MFHHPISRQRLFESRVAEMMKEKQSTATNSEDLQNKQKQYEHFPSSFEAWKIQQWEKEVEEEAQRRLDNPTQSLHKTPPTTTPESSNSRSYCTKLKSTPDTNIRTIHRTISLKKMKTGEDQIEESKESTATVSMIACPTDSANVIAHCPLFLP